MGKQSAGLEALPRNTRPVCAILRHVMPAAPTILRTPENEASGDCRHGFVRRLFPACWRFALTNNMIARKIVHNHNDHNDKAMIKP
jgi:hypothetical protein